MTFFYSSQAGTWLSMDMYRFISQFLVATKCKEPSFIKQWHFNLYWTPFSIFALGVPPNGDLSTLIVIYVYEATRLPTINWVWTLKWYIASILHVYRYALYHPISYIIMKMYLGYTSISAECYHLMSALKVHLNYSEGCRFKFYIVTPS